MTYYLPFASKSTKSTKLSTRKYMKSTKHTYQIGIETLRTTGSNAAPVGQLGKPKMCKWSSSIGKHRKSRNWMSLLLNYILCNSYNCMFAQNYNLTSLEIHLTCFELFHAKLTASSTCSSSHGTILLQAWYTSWLIYSHFVVSIEVFCFYASMTTPCTSSHLVRCVQWMFHIYTFDSYSSSKPVPPIG